jgi:hypothetical protein
MKPPNGLLQLSPRSQTPQGRSKLPIELSPAACAPISVQFARETSTCGILCIYTLK